MVVIRIKPSDGSSNNKNDDGFLFETTTDTANDDLIESLVHIHNERLRSKVIVDSVRGLIQYGIMKDPSVVVGVAASGSTVSTSTVSTSTSTSVSTNVDPTGMRMGNAPPPQDSKIIATLSQVVQDLDDYVNGPKMIRQKIAMDAQCLRDKIANVRGAVLMAYPMGLPSYDLVKIALDGGNEDEDEDGNDWKSTYIANQLLDPSTASLWWAGKPFQRGVGCKVSDRLGGNEKTKVIAKLQCSGGPPPAREPIVNEEERKAMMAHYFKRQEELKKLAEAEDDQYGGGNGDGDDYLNSQWADSRQMKRTLQGLDGGIKAPGLRFP